MKERIKKTLKIVAWAHLAIWSIFFIGVICTLMSQTSDVILILLYAGMVMGLLGLFSVGMKRLPIKFPTIRSD